MTAEPPHLARLARKRMAAGALFFDMNGLLLLVKPTYRPEWLIPGGSVEADESPYACCVREVREELGLLLPIGRMLCVDYCSAEPHKSESLQFIFEGGVLDAERVAQITLPVDELSAWRFVAAEEASELLAPRLARRVMLAIAACHEQRTIYAEDGVEVP